MFNDNRDNVGPKNHQNRRFIGESTKIENSFANSLKY